MKNELKIVRLDVDYCNYLRIYDNRVPYNFDKKILRPFVGVLFEINGCKYFAPLSSPKAKHLKMKSKIDFLRLDNGKLGAINFNNMLPVQDCNVVVLDLDKKCVSKEDAKYQKLLKQQIYWLNRHDERLYSRSKKLYDDYVKGNLKENVVNRCCNFPLLEQKCAEYNKTLVCN